MTSRLVSYSLRRNRSRDREGAVARRDITLLRRRSSRNSCPADPLQNRLVFGGAFGPALAAAVRRGGRARDAFGFGRGDGFAQQQAILRILPIDHVLHGRPGGIEERMRIVAVHAGIAVGALLLQNRLDVGAEEPLVERCRGGDGNVVGDRITWRGQVEGTHRIRRIRVGFQLVRQFERGSRCGLRRRVPPGRKASRARSGWRCAPAAHLRHPANRAAAAARARARRRSSRRTRSARYRCRSGYTPAAISSRPWRQVVDVAAAQRNLGERRQ